MGREVACAVRAGLCGHGIPLDLRSFWIQLMRSTAMHFSVQ